MPPPLNENVKPDIDAPVKSGVIDTSFRDSLKEALGIGPKKPSKWRHRTVAPYYKHRFAVAFRDQCLEIMMKEMTDFCYFYKDFAGRMTPNSLYLFVNQASRFLVDPVNNLDPEKKYANFMECITITREPNVGIRLSLHRDLRSGQLVDLTPKPVHAKEEVPKYMIRINNFIEEAEEGDILDIKDLALSMKQVEQIEEMFSGLKSFLSKVDPQRIRIVKLTLKDNNTPHHD